MAYLALFFALLCFQISRGGVLQTDTLHNEKPSLTVELEKPNPEKSSEDIWTEEDEKWFEEIQNLLGEDSDEDYDVSDLEFEKLIQKIEELMKEHHPEKSSYEWLQNIATWLFDADYDSNEELDEDDFFSWSSQKNNKIAKESQRLLQKRFSSV